MTYRMGNMEVLDSMLIDITEKVYRFSAVFSHQIWAMKYQSFFKWKKSILGVFLFWKSKPKMAAWKKNSRLVLTAWEPVQAAVTHQDIRKYMVRRSRWRLLGVMNASANRHDLNGGRDNLWSVCFPKVRVKTGRRGEKRQSYCTYIHHQTGLTRLHNENDCRSSGASRSGVPFASYGYYMYNCGWKINRKDIFNHG